jgi:sulfate transport system permease protein
VQRRRARQRKPSRLALWCRQLQRRPGEPLGAWSLRVQRQLLTALVTLCTSSLLVSYLSLVVLIPIAALGAHGLGLSVLTHGWGIAFWHWSIHSDFSGFWADVTQASALHAIWLSIWLSLLAAGINAVAGLATAWVLVRDEFPGKRVLESIIDLPFALPTIVAGVVFVFLYGPNSPVGVDLVEKRAGLLVAMLFVTLPFSVRAVQPVLESLEGHAEAAARSLGARPSRAFFSVVLPSLLPAVLSGFGLAFARAIGEFGAISLIAGGISQTMLASYFVFLQTQQYTYTEAAAVATALLVVSLLILTSCTIVSRRIQLRLSS